MPQKQPPATTAVSEPFAFDRGASIAGSGTFTAALVVLQAVRPVTMSGKTAQAQAAARNMRDSFHLRFYKIQGPGVDAVAQPGRARAIRKDVAEMSVTPPARHGRPHHPEGGVTGLFHVFRGHGLREARPACTRLKLCIGIEQRRSTADAAIETVIVVVPVFSSECCLGAVSTGNVKRAG